MNPDKIAFNQLLQQGNYSAQIDMEGSQGKSLKPLQPLNKVQELLQKSTPFSQGQASLVLQGTLNRPDTLSVNQWNKKLKEAIEGNSPIRMLNHLLEEAEKNHIAISVENCILSIAQKWWHHKKQLAEKLLKMVPKGINAIASDNFSTKTHGGSSVPLNYKGKTLLYVLFDQTDGYETFRMVIEDYQFVTNLVEITELLRRACRESKIHFLKAVCEHFKKEINAIGGFKEKLLLISMNQEKVASAHELLNQFEFDQNEIETAIKNKKSFETQKTFISSLLRQALYHLKDSKKSDDLANIFFDIGYKIGYHFSLDICLHAISEKSTVASKLVQIYKDEVANENNATQRLFSGDLFRSALKMKNYEIAAELLPYFFEHHTERALEALQMPTNEESAFFATLAKRYPNGFPCNFELKVHILKFLEVKGVHSTNISKLNILLKPDLISDPGKKAEDSAIIGLAIPQELYPFLSQSKAYYDAHTQNPLEVCREAVRNAVEQPIFNQFAKEWVLKYFENPPQEYKWRCPLIKLDKTYKLQNSWAILLWDAFHLSSAEFNTSIVEFLLSDKFLKNSEFCKELSLLIKNACQVADKRMLNFIDKVLKNPTCKKLIDPIIDELIELSNKKKTNPADKMRDLLKAYKKSLEINEAKAIPSKTELDFLFEKDSTFNDFNDLAAFLNAGAQEAPSEMVQKLKNDIQKPSFEISEELDIDLMARIWESYKALLISSESSGREMQIFSRQVFQKISDYFHNNANFITSQFELEHGYFNFNFYCGNYSRLLSELFALINHSYHVSAMLAAIVDALEAFGFYGNIQECPIEIKSREEQKVWKKLEALWNYRKKFGPLLIFNRQNTGDAPTFLKLKLAELKKLACEIVSFHKNGGSLFPQLSGQAIPVLILEDRDGEEFVLRTYLANFDSKGMLVSLFLSKIDTIPKIAGLLTGLAGNFENERDLTISKMHCNFLLNMAKEELESSEIPPFLVFFKTEPPSIPSNHTFFGENEAQDSGKTLKANTTRVKRKTQNITENSPSTMAQKIKKPKTLQATDLISIENEDEISIEEGEFWTSLSVKTINKKIKTQQNNSLKNQLKKADWEETVAPLDYPAGMLKKADPAMALPPLFLESRLMQYQKDNIQAILSAMLNNLNGFLLADEMGLGKTIQSAELLLQALHLKQKPVLFLSTASTLKQTKDSLLKSLLDAAYFNFQQKIDACKSDIEASVVFSQIRSYLVFFDNHVKKTKEKKIRDKNKIQKKAKRIEKLKRPFVDLLGILESKFSIRCFEDIDLEPPFNENPFEIIHTCSSNEKLTNKLNELSVNPQKRILLSTHDLIVECNKEGVVRHAEALKKSQLSFIGIDEAQNFDEEKSNRFKNLLKIFDQLEPEHYPFIVPTTGTPYENKIDNIFAILRMMSGMAPDEKKQFDETRRAINLLIKDASNEVMKYADGKRVSVEKAYQALKRAFIHVETLRTILRSRTQRHLKESEAVKRDWGETKLTEKIVLPPVKLQLIGNQKTRSEWVHKKFKGDKSFIEAAEKNKIGYLAFNQKNQQVLVHSDLGYGQDSDNKVAEKVRTLKKEDLKAWIKQSAMLDQIVNVYGQTIYHECAPTLIFVESLAAGNIIKTCLEKTYAMESIPFISGSTAHSDRKKIVKEFNKTHPKKPRVVVLMRKAAGAGLDFKGATLEIFAQTPFNTFALKQAEGRGDRVNCITETGERKKLYVVYFDCETEGEKYLQRIRKHKELWGNYFLDAPESSEENCSANFLAVAEAICRSLHHTYCVGEKLGQVDKLLELLSEEARNDDTLWECVQRTQPSFVVNNENDNMDLANDIELSLIEANQKSIVFGGPSPLAKKAVVTERPPEQAMEITKYVSQKILNVIHIDDVVYYKLPSMSLRDAVCIASTITRGNNSVEKQKQLYECIKSSDEKSLNKLIDKWIQPWMNTNDKGALNYCHERSIEVVEYEPLSLAARKLVSFVSPVLTIKLLRDRESEKYQLLLIRSDNE